MENEIQKALAFKTKLVAERAAPSINTTTQNEIKKALAFRNGVNPPPKTTPTVPFTGLNTPTVSAKKAPLRWIGEQISKPGNMLAAVTEGLAKPFDPNYGISQIPKNLFKVATGQSTRGYLQQAEEAIPGPGGTIAGLGVSIVADPLNVIGGGLTKLGKAAEIVTKAKKAGEVIVEGSKTWNKLAKAGYTTDELVLANTKAEQALKGQRAFLKAGNVPLLPAKTSAAIYKGLGKTGDAISKIPGAAYVGEKITAGRKLFNTGTGNEAFDKFVTARNNSVRYMENIGVPVEMQKNLFKISKPEEYHQVADYIQKGIAPTNEKLKQIGDDLKVIFAEQLKQKQAAGLPVQSLGEYYFPQIKNPEFKGDLPEGIGRSKVYSTEMGSAHHRDITAFEAADGHRIISSVKGGDLRPVDNVKGLTHDITWGEYVSLKAIEDRLAQSGVKIEYKPQKFLRTSSGNANGYFDPVTRKLVIASKRPTLDMVMSTLKHELTHNAHFQLAGNIEMLDNIAHAAGGLQKVMLEKTLLNAKAAVKKEWRQILQQVSGITPEMFAKMSKVKQDYYTTSTELLARVGQAFLDNPEAAKVAFPESFAAFNELRRLGSQAGFDLLDTKITPGGEKIFGEVFKDKNGKLFQQFLSGPRAAGLSEIEKAFGKEGGKKLLIDNPALALAYTIKENARAVSNANFLEGVKRFALEEGKGGFETTIPELKGLKFDKAIAEHLDKFHEGINPKEIKAMFKMFDSVQNLWKGQALFSISYHTRNMVGNVWNLYLMGVKNPKEYWDAGLIQKTEKGKALEITTNFGKKYKGSEILDLAERRGVINTGQFTADIPTTLENEVKGGNWNPLSSENKALRANRMVGGGIEDNAKLTGFIHNLKKGMSPDEAAMEVKKFLFDYSDLTPFEQTVMKRFLPFYTFTRKNLPLQLEQLVKQPQKYAQIERVVQAIESNGARNNPAPNEKYLSDYIKSNTAMRVKYNPEDKSYSYMLLGKWIPSYQAMDWIAQPTDNLIGMLSPLMKTPFELGFNTSSFWKNSLGNYQDIERYPGEQTSFLGLNMRKKTAQLLRNITLLNNIDKANPGLIFGGKQTDHARSLAAKIGLPAVNLPLGIGNISPSEYKYTTSGVSPSATTRAVGLALGSNLTSYKPGEARTYYNQDTDKAIQELERAVDRARATRDLKRAKLIQDQIKQFKKERGR